MNKSEQINDLAASLSKAQSELEDAKKNSVNPHFKSKYADLSAVLAECRKILPGHGLSVVQSTAVEGENIILTTTLMHSSGQWISGQIPLIMGKRDMQGMGSAISYARRYGLSALVGISQEDDDGNVAKDAHYEEKFERAPQEVPSWDEIVMKEEKVKNHAPKFDSKIAATCHHKWIKSQYKNKTTGLDQEYCPTCRSQRDLVNK